MTLCVAQIRRSGKRDPWVGTIGVGFSSAPCPSNTRTRNARPVYRHLLLRVATVYFGKWYEPRCFELVAYLIALRYSEHREVWLDPKLRIKPPWDYRETGHIVEKNMWFLRWFSLLLYWAKQKLTDHKLCSEHNMRSAKSHELHTKKRDYRHSDRASWLRTELIHSR